MSEQVILDFMRSLERRLDRLQQSVNACQARCAVDLAVRKTGTARRSKLTKAAVGLAVAGVGALAEYLVNH